MYFKKLFIALLVSLGLCYVTGAYFDKRYKKNFATLFFNSTDTILDQSKKYDIILLGNSRVHFGLNPFYIDSITGLSSYNFGIGGSDAAMLSLNTSLYLQNHPPPAYAIIGSDISLLTDNKAIQSQCHYLFYLSNDSVYSTLRHYNASLLIARYLPFLKYSFFDAYNRAFIFREKPEFERFEHNVYKGFINPHHAGQQSPLINFIATGQKEILSQASIDMMKQTIKQLKAAGTRIIIVSPPLKTGISKEARGKFAEADAVFKNIAAENAALFVNMNNMQPSQNNYFTDDLHLNEPGTKIFSRQVGMMIDSLVKGLKKIP